MSRRRLEEAGRFSESIVWQLQRRVYADLGLRAWQQKVVPTQISTNPFLAHAYAELILAFARDCASQRSDREPLTVIDFCAGSGRLAWHLARELADAQGGRPPLRVILTDFSPAHLRGWGSHPPLQPWIEAGALDFATFDAANPGPLELCLSHEKLEPGALSGPLVVVASYALDSLACDAFAVSNGALCEARLRAEIDGDPDGMADRDVLAGLTLERELRPAPRPYYDEPRLDSVLDVYREADGLEGAAFWLPTEAIRALDYLASLTRAETLLLCGDKGYRTLAEVGAERDLHLARHGTVSVNVNLHALGLAVEQAGGRALHSRHPDRSFTLSGFVVPGAQSALQDLDLAQTRRAFAAIERFGPRDYQLLVDEFGRDEEASLETTLRLIGLGCYDPWVFGHSVAAIKKGIRTASPALLDELARTLQEVWRRCYRLGGGDLAFDLGSCFYNMGRKPEARTFFEVSLVEEEEHPATYCNLGDCHRDAGDRAAALDAYRRSLALDPAYERALGRLAELEQDGPPPDRSAR